MLHLPVALNTKELVGDMSIAVLLATFPHTPSFSYLGHPHVPAQVDVALASGPEHKGVGGRHVHELMTASPYLEYENSVDARKVRLVLLETSVCQ